MVDFIILYGNQRQANVLNSGNQLHINYDILTKGMLEELANGQMIGKDVIVGIVDSKQRGDRVDCYISAIDKEGFMLSAWKFAARND